jgi:hypothetical protein
MSEAAAVAYRPARGYRWFWGAACLALDALWVAGIFLLSPFTAAAIVAALVLVLCGAACAYAGAMLARSYVVVDDDGITFRNVRRRVYEFRWDEILRVELGAQGKVTVFRGQRKKRSIDALEWSWFCDRKAALPVLDRLEAELGARGIDLQRKKGA